jgi:DNA-binding NarL/FixJ family response regulator
VPAADSREDRGVRTVLVVDDHADFRTSVRALLEADGFLVVGEAGTGADAIRAATDLTPDVVLLDIRLPDLDGIAVADTIAALPWPPDVVLVSSRDRSVYSARLTHARVRGFLAKGELSGPALRGMLG